MLNAHFKPLNQWSGPRTKGRKAATFRVKYLQTLDLLEYELGKLRAEQIVIQIEDPEAIKGMRNDGSLRTGTRHTPSKPGVILSFESPKGNISMPCDRYYFWQDNLRAIALSLEALRAVDRYGVTRGNEQYRGWAQIEAPKNGMSREQATEFLQLLLNVTFDPRTSREQLAEICRKARIAYHPDRAADDENQRRHRHEMFVRIGQAEQVLCSEEK